MSSIYIFQHDLRIDSNQLMLKALGDSKNLKFIFIKPVDYNLKDNLGFDMWSKPKKRFFLQALESLAVQLDDQQFIFLEEYEDLKFFMLSNKILKVYFAESPFSYENIVKSHIPESVEIVTGSNSKLINFGVLNLNPDKDPSFTKFRKQTEKLNWPLAEISDVSSVSKNRNLNPDYIYDSADINHRAETNVLDWCRSELKTLGNIEIAFDLQGTRASALKHLDEYIWNKKHICHYKKTRNGMIEFYDSSKLSGWLAIGALSPIEVFKQIIAYETKYSSNSSTYWFKLELLWRDYFKFISEAYRDLFFKEAGIDGQNSKLCAKEENLEMFEEWTQGKTKNSFINANMIELRQTGFMSNRGRQNVASYLVHELKQSWWWGAKWFESQLIDYDPASNYGNWHYIAGVGIWSAHKFDYDWQSKNYDPNKSYQKKWQSKI